MAGKDYNKYNAMDSINPKMTKIDINYSELKNKIKLNDLIRLALIGKTSENSQDENLKELEGKDIEQIIELIRKNIKGGKNIYLPINPKNVIREIPLFPEFPEIGDVPTDPPVLELPRTPREPKPNMPIFPEFPIGEVPLNPTYPDILLPNPIMPLDPGFPIELRPTEPNSPLKPGVPIDVKPIAPVAPNPTPKAPEETAPDKPNEQLPETSYVPSKDIETLEKDAKMLYNEM